MRGRSFRLATATIALDGDSKSLIIPAGSIIVVVSDCYTTGLVYVLVNGRRLRMYEKDIRDRGTLVVTDAAVR